jgi:aryl-alcohol dehydrogenase-like predicted oxidoreductase
MEHRELGTTGVNASVISLGTWAIGGWMWGGTNEEESIKTIQESIDLGITSIDTAPVYGGGTSEKIVGKAIKGKQDKVKIFTKYGLRWDLKQGVHHFDMNDEKGKTYSIYKNAKKESIIYECEQSLKRLGVDKIDLYQIHWPDPSTPIQETMEAVQELTDQGKVVAAGVCNYNVDELAEANKNINIASNQVPYSMVNRKIESGVVPYTIENNIGILAYSPLQRGLLTGKYSKSHQFDQTDTRKASIYFKPENIDKVNAFLKKIKPIADGHNASLTQLVIAWTKQQPGISSVLVGARSSAQAKDNISAAQMVLKKDEVQTINSELENVIVS